MTLVRGGLMTRLVCPCSAVVERINDGKNEEVYAECPICSANGGHYALSPHWKELKPAAPDATTSRTNSPFQTGLLLSFKAVDKDGKKGKPKKAGAVK